MVARAYPQAVLLQFKHTSVHGLPLLQGGAQRPVQPVLQVEVATPGDDVGEEVAVEGRVLGQQGLEVELPLGRHELITTKRELELDRLLDEDSTFYGDLFPHAVQWEGDLYLEDGLHRALRAALQQRNSLHVRVLSLDEAVPAAEG